MKCGKVIGSVFFWLFTVAVMIVIFLFSCEDGEKSEQLSGDILTLIIEYIGNFISHNVLRKLAHFTEFAALGFFMSGAIYFTFDRRKFYISLIPCALYAVSDEIHQYFVPERACRIFDIFVDSCGSSLGILVFLLIINLILKKRSRRF